MRWLLAVLLLGVSAGIQAAETNSPVLIARPEAFSTLVNPRCSHCRDEAKRRATDLRTDDRVLCWIRGYSDGGTIPLRFFLNRSRVISDTYGVFVYDPDAGYARGFAPSLDFTFYGWRNGVMVMKHKDGTLFSCLTGVAFAGPRKGERLKPVPTLMSDWGVWLRLYPQAVAYHMFDKYQPTELPTRIHPDSRKSRAPADKRLPEDTSVLGLHLEDQARAYPLGAVEKAGLLTERVGKEEVIILWDPTTRSAAAYEPRATPPKESRDEPRRLTLKVERTKPDAPFVDQETGSRWDIAGRAVEGRLKGWTLTWRDGVQVKWFAWAAEYPATTLYSATSSCHQKEDKPSSQRKSAEKIREIAGTAEFLRALPKKHARLQDVDPTRRQVTLRIEGDKADTTWTLLPDAEVRIAGWWGRFEQLPRGERVWVWFKLNRKNKPSGIFFIGDEVSEQDLHGAGVTLLRQDGQTVSVRPVRGETRTLKVATKEVFMGTNRVELARFKAGDKIYVQTRDGEVRLLLDAAAFEHRRQQQRKLLNQRWEREGLPGTVTILHLTGEMDFLLDHEGIRWGRSLQAGDEVQLLADPPIKAVVKQVNPWRERTLLRLVVKGSDQADLTIGERLSLKMKPPTSAIEESPLPPDVDRPRSTEQRVEWFLASIYCTCKVGNDTCTGHYYTLASCNPNGCGMPGMMRKKVAEKIARGQTDRQIFEDLLREQGPLLIRPHLLP